MYPPQVTPCMSCGRIEFRGLRNVAIFDACATQRRGHGSWVGDAQIRQTRTVWCVDFVSCDLWVVIFKVATISCCTRVGVQKTNATPQHF